MMIKKIYKKYEIIFNVVFFSIFLYPVGEGYAILEPAFYVRFSRGGCGNETPDCQRLFQAAVAPAHLVCGIHAGRLILCPAEKFPAQMAH